VSPRLDSAFLRLFPLLPSRSRRSYFFSTSFLLASRSCGRDSPGKLGVPSELFGRTRHPLCPTWDIRIPPHGPKYIAFPCLRVDLGTDTWLPCSTCPGGSPASSPDTILSLTRVSFSLTYPAPVPLPERQNPDRVDPLSPPPVFTHSLLPSPFFFPPSPRGPEEGFFEEISAFFFKFLRSPLSSRTSPSTLYG